MANQTWNKLKGLFRSFTTGRVVVGRLTRYILDTLNMRSCRISKNKRLGVTLSENSDETDRNGRQCTTGAD